MRVAMLVMMRKCGKGRLIGGLLSLLLVLPACKKDYPSDIPDWVEDRVRKCKQPFTDCHGLKVMEYAGLGQRWFYFRQANGNDELFTEGASSVCAGNDLFVWEAQCQTLPLDSLHPVRTIWVED